MHTLAWRRFQRAAASRRKAALPSGKSLKCCSAFAKFWEKMAARGAAVLIEHP